MKIANAGALHDMEAIGFPSPTGYRLTCFDHSDFKQRNQ
jgi:hypothetical protein